MSATATGLLHLRARCSVRAGDGALMGAYDDDPYGRQISVSGLYPREFGYAGMHHHVSSGLWLTRYRAYDSQTARWLSRDPIEEEGASIYTPMWGGTRSPSSIRWGSNLTRLAGRVDQEDSRPRRHRSMCLCRALGRTMRSYGRSTRSRRQSRNFVRQKKLIVIVNGERPGKHAGLSSTNNYSSKLVEGRSVA